MDRAGFLLEERTGDAPTEIVEPQFDDIFAAVPCHALQPGQQSAGFERRQRGFKPAPNLRPTWLRRRRDQRRQAASLGFRNRNQLPAAGPAPRPAGNGLALALDAPPGGGHHRVGQPLKHRQQVFRRQGTGGDGDLEGRGLALDVEDDVASQPVGRAGITRFQAHRRRDPGAGS